MNKRTIAELKAWFGFNWSDFFLNVGFIPFLLGVFIPNLLVVVILFIVATFMILIGIILYLTKPNTSISRTSAFLNKWLSISGGIVAIGVMIYRVWWLVRLLL